MTAQTQAALHTQPLGCQFCTAGAQTVWPYADMACEQGCQSNAQRRPGLSDPSRPRPCPVLHTAPAAAGLAGAVPLPCTLPTVPKLPPDASDFTPDTHKPHMPRPCPWHNTQSAATHAAALSDHPLTPHKPQLRSPVHESASSAILCAPDGPSDALARQCTDTVSCSPQQSPSCACCQLHRQRLLASFGEQLGAGRCSLEQRAISRRFCELPGQLSICLVSSLQPHSALTQCPGDLDPMP